MMTADEFEVAMRQATEKYAALAELYDSTRRRLHEEASEKNRLRNALTMYQGLYEHALDCVDKVYQGPDAIISDLPAGRDKFEAVVWLAKRYKQLLEGVSLIAGTRNYYGDANHVHSDLRILIREVTDEIPESWN